MSEVRPIPGWEKYYAADSEGAIHSLPCVIEYERCGRLDRFTRKGGVLKSRLDKDGYPYVVLCAEGIRKTCKVHRLVCLAFRIIEHDSKRQINHINGVKEDNRLSNLEAVTASQNIQHAHRTGLAKARKGSSNNFSILVESSVIKIKERILSGDSYTAIARDFGVSQPAISQIACGNNWSEVTGWSKGNGAAKRKTGPEPRLK